jgi:3-oxoadipate enol-lactonase
MSAIVLHQQVTHYEIIGRGQPVVFLHSWLGSWRTWMPMMEMISDRYRAIALDFSGFGDSAQRSEPPTIDRYVEQLLAFVDALGMLPPHLVGHGLGGIVAVRAARSAPDRFGKIAIAGTPVVGSLMQPTIKPGGLGRLLGKSAGNDTWVRQVRQMSTGDEAYDELLEDIEGTSPALIQALVDAIGTLDLQPTIADLRTPLLAIYGGKDRIVTADHGERITEAHDTFRQVLMLDKSGHFPFIDQPTQFSRALLEFLSGSDKAIELKETWKRRVSQREFL